MRWFKRGALVGLAAGALLALAELLAPAGQLPEGFVYGVDSYGGIDADTASKVNTVGVQIYVQALTALPYSGIMQPPTRVVALRNAYEQGLTIAGYALVGDELTGAGYIDYARSGVPDDLWDALAFIAVDVEVQSASYQTVLDALDRLEQLGKPRVVYTNYNSWVSYLGNPPFPAGTYLWNAYWDDSPDFDYPRLPYGNLPEDFVMGEQWSGGVDANGTGVDRDIFRLQILPQVAPPTPTPEPPVEPTATPVEPIVTPPVPPYMPPIRPPCCACSCTH